MTDTQQDGDQRSRARRRAHGSYEGSGEEVREGAPEWLISFADNLALLMGFFVILLAMNLKVQTHGGIGGSEKNAAGSPLSTELPDAQSASESMLDLSIAIREAFNNPVNLSSNDPRDQVLIRRLFQRAGVSRIPQSGPKGREHDMEAVRPTDYQAPFGTVLFARDSAELTERAGKRIAEIAARARGRTLVVEVRGHVSAAEAFHRAEQSMKLSFDRALAVAEVLAQNGVDWWQIRLLACGDHERVSAFPGSQHEDAVNSRVEVVVTDQVVPEAVPTQPDEAQNSDRWP